MRAEGAVGTEACCCSSSETQARGRGEDLGSVKGEGHAPGKQAEKNQEEAVSMEEVRLPLRGAQGRQHKS